MADSANGVLGSMDPLAASVVEADECSMNSGEETRPHPMPDDTRRRRADKRRGHVTLAETVRR